MALTEPTAVTAAIPVLQFCETQQKIQCTDKKHSQVLHEAAVNHLQNSVTCVYNNCPPKSMKAIAHSKKQTEEANKIRKLTGFKD